MKVFITTAYYIFFGIITTAGVVIVISIVYALTMLFTFNKKLGRKASHFIAKLWGRITSEIAFLRVHIEGLENYDKNKLYIITANHQSAFDILFCLMILKGEFAFLAKDTLFNIPCFGFAMKCAGYISVKRGTIGALKSIDDMTNVMSNNISLLMYPEGTRSITGEIGKPKKGMLKLAERFPDVEILPVVFDGTRNVLKPKSLKVSLFKKANVRFLKPYKMSESGLTDNEKLDYWYNLMSSNYKEVKIN